MVLVHYDRDMHICMAGTNSSRERKGSEGEEMWLLNILAILSELFLTQKARQDNRIERSTSLKLKAFSSLKLHLLWV